MRGGASVKKNSFPLKVEKRGGSSREKKRHALKREVERGEELEAAGINLINTKIKLHWRRGSKKCPHFDHRNKEA